MIIQEVIVDEFGRLWLATDNGDPYSGPYDTFEEAEAALYAGDEDADDWVGESQPVSPARSEL
jgi:hypothetical protein